MNPTRILVPLDGSVLAESALAMAVELAGLAGGSLILLRAVKAHTFPGGDVVQAQVQVVREAERYLSGVKEHLQAHRAQGSRLADITTSVWYGDAAPSITEAARVNGVGMIVMTTHGRSGFGRLVLGSVTESVLHGTSTPVLVLHPEGAPVATPVGAGSPAQPEASATSSGARWTGAGR